MNVTERLDAELASMLERNPVASIDWELFDLGNINELRGLLESSQVPPQRSTHGMELHDHEVPGPSGAPPVMLRIYEPQPSDEKSPCIYWIHGGGFISGSALREDPMLGEWAQKLSCKVVAVNYRLAPETSFPGPLEDAYAGLDWTIRNAATLGIDSDRLAVVGASAGGGIAAGLALAVRDRGEFQIHQQVLLYPMLDDRSITTSSSLETVVWTPTANLLGWSAYLGGQPGAENIHPYAAPARAEDLSGLPTSFIAVGTLDLFRDESILYALRLLEGGVETELHVYPGAPHGFATFGTGSALAKRCAADIEAALVRGFANH